MGIKAGSACSAPSRATDLQVGQQTGDAEGEASLQPPEAWLRCSPGAMMLLEGVPGLAQGQVCTLEAHQQLPHFVVLL